MTDRVQRSADLRYLLDQGVLLLNSDLTCKLNKTNSHSKLWEPFQEFFLQTVLRGTKGIIYVLAGNESHRMEKFINPLGNHIFKIEHPAAASRRHTDWYHKNIFSTTNKILKADGRETIEWNRAKCPDEEPPF